MKKVRFLIPIIIIAALAITAFALAQTRLLTTTQTVAPAETQPTVQSTTQTATQPAEPAVAQTTAQPIVKSTDQTTETDMLTINGIVVDRKKLVDNLDKTSDETIKYAYEQSTDNITIGNVYEGNFSDRGKPELLVIFKLLGMPHAGGLDCSVAALYDMNTRN